MRPRLIAVDDDAPASTDIYSAAIASMRPRLIAVDDMLPCSTLHVDKQRASMRPRLIAVDDAVQRMQESNAARRFNEATAYCRG